MYTCYSHDRVLPGKGNELFTNSLYNTMPAEFMSNLFNLSGKTALVTGCNKGIGKSMALGLAEAGANIIGVSASLAVGGSAVEKEVLALGRNFAAYQADLTDRSSLYGFISHVKKDHSRIDILVNNAGMILRAPAAEHPDES